MGENFITMAGSNDFIAPRKSFVLSVLLVFLYFSTSANSQNVVRYLPGFPGPLPFELETGYVSVDDSDDMQFFYYFVKSESKPSEDPLILWTTGGPGCSVLTALAFEIGPLLFKKAKYDGSLPSLELNPYSWTKLANIIFFDSPVNTGFSYSRSGRGSTDSATATQAYVFLKKWLNDHPQFLFNPLYIGGDSYAGKIIPISVQHLSDGIRAGNQPLINLKGYLLGNPYTDLVLETNAKIRFAHGMGILPDDLYESAKKHCGGDYVNVDPNNLQCTKDIKAMSQCTSTINDAQILEPKCMILSPKPPQLIRKRSSLEENSSNIIPSVPTPGFECRTYGYMVSYYWANDIRVRKALNIRTGTVEDWVRCNQYDPKYVRDMDNTTMYHSMLSRRHYRSLIYSGDHDMLIPHWGTQEWIQSLNYSIIDEWRLWSVGGQVAGFTRTYTNNMTFATVKGGGHTAPEYKPKECFAMFKRWLSYESL